MSASGFGVTRDASTGDRGLIRDGGLPPSNSWVLPDHKIVYISVTKVACSGLRWMLADLAGEDMERFHRATGPHLTRLMTVHGRRENWRHVGRLSDMPREEVDRISPADGWFVFAVVRDPWSRLWSAWQSKFLVQHPTFVDKYGDEPWFPRVPTSATDVLQDWRTFVAEHPWTDHPELRRDAHFWPQVRSVRPDGLSYSRVYDLGRLSELTTDLHEHLDGLGLDQPLYLPRANETPLAITADVLADGLAGQVEDLFRADFDRFGDRWDLARLRVQDAWSPDALKAVGFHVAVNQRIGDLSSRALELQQELREARRELRVARRELQARQPSAPASPGLVGRAARAVRRRLT